MNSPFENRFTTALTEENHPLIIAEIAQNHDGSLGTCHAYIDALAEAGADAVKFQTHIAAEESTMDEAFRVRFSQQDDTRYDYWKRMEFTAEQWAGLKQHADEKAIEFISTPFSLAAVEMLTKIGVRLWKVGSGDTFATHMLDALLQTRLPLIVSTGMSDWQEIDELVGYLKQHQANFSLMQCTSMYPTPLTHVGLNILHEMQQKYGCRIGLSDHSGSLTPARVAMARGFGLVELHATFDRRMFGPDIASSVTIDDVGELARYARELQQMNAHPVDKNALAEELRQQKELFGRSVALKLDCSANHVIKESDLLPKKPGNGIAWADRNKVAGRVLKKQTASNVLLKWEDME